MKVLQLNTNHSKTAQDLLWQTVAEHNVDVAILSEPYKCIDSPNWVTDSEKQAALWVLGNKTPECKMTTSNRGFTWVKLEGTYYVSCYAPPRWTIEDFKHMLTALELELRGKSPILIAGDFNAWSTTWGSNFTNPRGRLVEETFAAMDLVLLNTPGAYTFDCTRGRSIIDLAFSDRNTANRTKWRVEETIHTQSDHLAIAIQTQEPAQQHQQTQQRTMQKRNGREQLLTSRPLVSYGKMRTFHTRRRKIWQSKWLRY